VLHEALERMPTMRLLAYCLMNNHWHLVLWPLNDGDLSRFMFWLTMTHTQRWRHARKLVGLGPLYQGRFKSFPVEADEHFLTLSRYVERNPVRAKIVRRAENWRWSSFSVRRAGEPERQRILHPWPVDQPSDWSDWVNQPQTDAEVNEMRRSIRTGRPYGNGPWQKKMAELLGIRLELGRAGRRPKNPHS
jgi:putative transposase